VYDIVPNEPPSVSVTVTLPSITVAGVLKLPDAVPEADPVGVKAAVLSQVAVAVFTNAAGEGADA